MRALRVIPLLVVLLFLVYLGVLFVEANQETVTITLGTFQTGPTRLGFVVMTSTLVGVFIGAGLATMQILLLFLQNHALRKRLGRSETPPATEAQNMDEPTSPDHDTLAP